MKEKVEGVIVEEEAGAVDPGAVILEVLGEVSVLGANGSEPSAINEILQEYRAGKYSGEEAIKKVLEIKNRKEDYH